MGVKRGVSMGRSELTEVLIILGAVIGVGWASYFLQMTSGGIGWIYTGQYPERALLTESFITLAFLTGIARWRLIWGANVFIWFLALLLFREYLVDMGVKRGFVVLGSILPLFNIGVVTVGYTNIDSLLFFIVVSWFTILQRQKGWKGMLPMTIGLSVMTVLVICPPVPAGNTMFNPIYLEFMLKKFFMTASVFLPLSIVGMYKAPRRLHKNLLLIPVYAVVFFIAVDWFRWWIMLSPIWVLYCFNNLKAFYKT